eukprot:TRINITY_DN20859_c0_g1_i1.p1 TRINITY_DN20859_c0_g1~~TRINITY_DN20859_c0_g1_i1.p1  ORF type:complete len:260 (-),score=39.76 TRINITY_DN20859_c0_g1_i1:141-920(-)
MLESRQAKSTAWVSRRHKLGDVQQSLPRRHACGSQFPPWRLVHKQRLAALAATVFGALAMASSLQESAWLGGYARLCASHGKSQMTAVAGRRQSRVSLQALPGLRPQLGLHWKKPHRAAVKPKMPDGKQIYPDDKPKHSRPQFGKFAMESRELSWVTSYQLEKARREIVNALGRSGKVYLRVYPAHAITQRIAESRMGASRGRFEYWVAALKPGVVIFEVDVEDEELARYALKKGSQHLAVKVGFAKQEEGPSMFELAG